MCVVYGSAAGEGWCSSAGEVGRAAALYFMLSPSSVMLGPGEDAWCQLESCSAED